MIQNPLIGVGSSGNLLADKRYAYAEALAAEGDLAAAADLYAQALEEAPRWAAAHLARGLALEKLGDLDGARAAMRAAAAHDEAGQLGAALHLDRLNGAAPRAMAPAYVAALFDQYAPRFDSHLVEGLGYRGPQVIAEALAGFRPAKGPSKVLDLGCGTGLMAPALATPGLVIDGIDLSAAMLAQAEAAGHYRHLWCGDCVALAGTLPARDYDMIVAADVLVYLGDLAPLFSGVARLLAPQGLFAATVQTESGSDTPYSLGPDLRFRHRGDYLTERLNAAGLVPLHQAPCVTRREAGVAVAGLVFVARRP